MEPAKRYAFFAVVLVALGYMGLIVYFAASGDTPREKMVSYDAKVAEITAEKAMAVLSSDWSEESLNLLVEERLRGSNWFVALRLNLPTLKSELGSLVHFEPVSKDVASKLRAKVPVVDVQATCVHTKGTSKARFLLTLNDRKWAIIAVEIEIMDRNPKSATGTGQV